MICKVLLITFSLGFVGCDQTAVIPADEVRDTRTAKTAGTGLVDSNPPERTSEAAIETFEIAGASQVQGVYDNNGNFIADAEISTVDGTSGEVGEWILTEADSQDNELKAYTPQGELIAEKSLASGDTEIEDHVDKFIVIANRPQVAIVDEEGREELLNCSSSNVSCQNNDDGKTEMSIYGAKELVLDGESRLSANYEEELGDDAPQSLADVKLSIAQLKKDREAIGEQIKAEKEKMAQPKAARKRLFDERKNLKELRQEVRKSLGDKTEKLEKIEEINSSIADVNSKITEIQSVLAIHVEIIKELNTDRIALNKAIKEARELFEQLRLQGTREIIISCASFNYKDETCSLGLEPEVKIISFGMKQQLSLSECKKGVSFGKTGKKNIWVKDGCRADFSLFVR